MTPVRPAASADMAAVARIAEDTGLFPGSMLPPMIAGYLDGSKSDLWLVADDGGRAIGFAFCEPERMTVGTWNLLALGVSPDHQSRGAGKALVADLERRLRGGGHRLLLVETIDTDEYARTKAFYRREGFTEEARLRDYYDEGLPRLIFAKRL